MYFARNSVMGIIGKCVASKVISLQRSQRYIKWDNFFLILLLAIVYCINVGLAQQSSYEGGRFVGEEEAEAIAIEANVRLAKIPCNFTTKTNCIYAEQLKLTLPTKDLLIQRSPHNTHEIVVSWVSDAGTINRTQYNLGIDNGNENSNSNNNNTTNNNNNNVRQKAQNDFYNFNWIFELLVCMMLASAFEICLLVLRNLRNISLVFYAFWSAFNARLQKLCYACAATTTANKSEQQRKRNVAIGEKRTLSYIFAILTWRASQTAKGSTTGTEENLRDENTNNAISYGHVTTMGDLLLLILFTHVYYQRQRIQQVTENEDPEELLEGHKDKNRSSAPYHKFYDKQNISINDYNNTFNDQNRQRRGLSKRCSHFCGNMYQQISSLQEHKTGQVKLTPPLTSYTTKIPYLTYCTGIVWYSCCFCQYSWRSCCYCCSNCRRWNQRCYIYIPLCNTIYCCCFYKPLKSFQDINFQYCCYLCCWPDFCHLNALPSHASYHCCCYFYCERLYNRCCLCNAVSNKTMSVVSVRSSNLLLLNKIKNYSLNAYRSTLCNCYSVGKVKCNNTQSYSMLYEIDGQSYALLYLVDGRSMFIYKRNYYQVAFDVFSSLLPQYLLSIKNVQTFLKWKKFHVAVVVMALIVICASSAGANYDHHHYYSSLFNRCHKHFSRCKQNKRHRRRRRRHQHCKTYRPQHYFYTTLIKCVKRQKAKKLHKKIVNKLHTKSAKLLTITSAIIPYEYSLAPTAPSTKAPMVRAIRRVRGSKPNIVWLLIGLIWFEGPKIVNCNVIINYQNQQQHEQLHQQQQQQQHQQTGNSHKETTTNSVNSNFEYKMENFNQMKTKSSNNNSNSNNSNNNNNNNHHNNNNNNNNSNNNNNKNKNNNNSNNAKNSNRSSTSSNIHLSVNFIPIINTIHFKHYCNSNYHQKLIRSSQRVQRALKTNPNLDTSITSSASLNYNNINDGLNTEQMPSSSTFQAINQESHAQSDLMRLESIKHQILFKLGLTRKPNVSHPLPKQFIWDTIYRADGIKSFHEFSNTNNFQDHHHFMPQQNYPYWSAKPYKDGFNVVSVHQHQQQQHQHRDDRSRYAGEDLEDGIDNIKRSLENNNVGRKKYNKNKQQQLLQRTALSKHYNNVINNNQNNNNDNNNYQKGASAENLNQQLSYTTNRNKLNNHTNKTVNNFTILKQTKHQQFHKNSQHSTITTTAKKTIIHQQQEQQQNRRHEQINQYTNNNNIQNQNNKNSNNNKNNNNNDNNVNNSNNNNNIIMVQKHIRNNNKYIEEAKKFTYLTDINSSDDSLNNMEYHNPDDFDDNNSIVRKQKQHEEQLQQLQQRQQQQQHNVLDEKTSENNHNHFNIDTNGDEGVLDIDVNADPDIIHHIEGDTDVKDDVNDDGDPYHLHNQKQQQQQHHHRHENYSPKLDTFDENDDFFGSTQEIITFAEKGKMYKNHRLVEFSHQNNEKLKQRLHVRNAEIHIRINKIAIKHKSRAGSGIKRKRLKIWIFQLIENNYTYKGFDHMAQFCASFEVDTSRLGWKKFDITTTVKEWYSRREGEKLRLLIDCTGCGKMYTVHLFNGNTAKTDTGVRERRIADERRNTNLNEINSKHFYNVSHNYENYTNFQYNHTIVVTDKDGGITRRNPVNPDEEDLLNSSRPFLVLHTEARRQRRVRRRAINCNGALHGQCCKESFYVSFKALGWDDWIIAPRGYFANYCRGDCTGPYRTPDTFQTFHAHFIEEYRKMGLLNGMQPCCAPIKFSSMSLIYYGDEGIIKRDLPKMVVDECGCP